MGGVGMGGAGTADAGTAGAGIGGGMTGRGVADSEMAGAAMSTEAVLRRLELTIVRRLDGLLQGDHLGLLPGQGTELAEGREYVPGDDVRRMDWNLTARTSVPHVRDVVADRELETWVLVDATASMDFGTARLEKRDLAVIALAAIGFLTERAGNRVGLQVLHGGRLLSRPARTGRAHLFGLLRTLLELPRTPPGATPGSAPAAGTSAPGISGPGTSGPGTSAPGETALARALRTLHRTVGRRGLVVAVSDFLDDPSDGPDPDSRGVFDWERPMRLLADRHQLLAVEVLDPRELTLPDVGLVTLMDPETGRRREVSTANRELRERYATAAREQRAAIAAALRRCGVARLELRTDRDWIRDLVRHTIAQRRTASAPRSLPAGGLP
jgi:uncharacterized protein (DUF58 family)